MGGNPLSKVFSANGIESIPEARYKVALSEGPTIEAVDKYLSKYAATNTGCSLRSTAYLRRIAFEKVWEK